MLTAKYDKEAKWDISKKANENEKIKPN